MCFDFLHNFCLKHFSFHEKFSEISYMYLGLKVKRPLFLSDLNETWSFSNDFRLILKYKM